MLACAFFLQDCIVSHLIVLFGQALLEGGPLSDTIFGILSVGPTVLSREKMEEKQGPAREEAVKQAWLLLMSVVEKEDLLQTQDSSSSLETLFTLRSNCLVTLLEYVQYNENPDIRLCSVQLLAHLR